MREYFKKPGFSLLNFQKREEESSPLPASCASGSTKSLRL